ncbi:MAG: helix-turn-helix transcriptional regulator [Gemmatimonadaceae bacterium]
MAGSSVVAKRLREARERAGLSQKRLGIRAGIDEFSASPRINQYERGKHAPDLLTAERLCRVLNVPLPYLYAKDDRLAEWILAFGKPDATWRRATRKRVLRRFKS